MHPDLYHIMKILGSHHEEVERHLEMLTFLHEMLHRLQIEASAFSGKNCIAITNVQEALQTLRHHLNLADYNSETFTYAHVAAAISDVQSRLEDRL